MSRMKFMLPATVLALAALGMAPGIVLAANPSCGDTLVTDTTLEADLDCSGLGAGNSALKIGAHNVVLDLNGYTIWGPPGVDQVFGVYGDAWDGWEVTDGTIADFKVGVYFSSNSLGRATWLTVAGNTGAGDDFGIYVVSGAGNKIKHNTVSGADRGIYLQHGAGNRVRDNHVTADVSAFETADEASTRFYDNTAVADTGFFDRGGANIWYVDNRANNGGTGFDLDCRMSGRVVAIDNEANDNGGDGFVVTECYAERGGKKSKSIFTGNDASGNGGIGFHATRNYNSEWYSNNADDNGSEGFYLVQPGGYDMRWNDADYNTSAGFALRSNVGNNNVRRLARNTATFNDEWGFEGDYAAPGRLNKAHDNVLGDCQHVQCV